MTDARRGAFNVVLVWRFDRFARSVEQLVSALAEFGSLKVDFVSHQESLDTSTAMGKAMFTVIAAMAELERSRNNGTKSGRAIGRPKLIFDRDKVIRLRQSGLSIPAVAVNRGSASGPLLAFSKPMRLRRGFPKPLAKTTTFPRRSKRFT
jgi:DNA invertase Pin-like site-specific DNA recombinase